MEGESAAYAKDPYNRTGSEARRSTTSVHVVALDGLVNVNSLFTIAVFVGLSLTTPGQQSLVDKCDAGPDVAKRLLVFEVVSFSFFLFSSLVAQGLKLAINLLNSKDVDEAFRAHINLKVLRSGSGGFRVGTLTRIVQSRRSSRSCPVRFFFTFPRPCTPSLVSPLKRAFILVNQGKTMSWS
ncbi:hypothetical protein MRB53_025909 [Persea americana]|uniref:Uncharacterized protein n=1 Tax=Persea americana TaxID=3435 RepID=A0ACC2LGV1_PERAE|nr:hypothetical protein MRB53_025909 [Persea americana]